MISKDVFYFIEKLLSFMKGDNTTIIFEPGVKII